MTASSGQDLAAMFKRSRAQYEIDSKPKTIGEIINYSITHDKPNTPIMQLIRWAKIPQGKSWVSLIPIVTSIQCFRCDSFIRLKSAEFFPKTNTIQLSKDIWDNKPDTEYYLYQVIAEAFKHHIFGADAKRFYFNLVFYSMGFDPYRDAEIKLGADLEDIAKDKV